MSQGRVEPRTIAAVAQVHVRTVARWAARHHDEQGLADRPRSGRPRRFGQAAQLTTIAVFCQQAPPLPGIHAWSLRLATAHFCAHPELLDGPISRATVHRILQDHALRPHRRRYYLQITDPDFFAKMDHLLPLYLDPPEHLFCFDECTCIQALERLSPDLPPEPHQPRRRDFDYRRHGITDLLAFLDPATGRVFGQCVPDHRCETLCRVFTAQVRTLPADAVIHYVMDNLATHYHDTFCHTVAQLSGVTYTPLKTGPERRAWLQSDHKRLVVHFTPFHASWLNRVEIWFGILKRHCLGHEHLKDIAHLCYHISAFLDTWNTTLAHPFAWSYTGQGLHAKAVRRFCGLLNLQTQQMDSPFLTRQLLLMSDLVQHYAPHIPAEDWQQLRRLAQDRHSYITRIIDTEARPRCHTKACLAHQRFAEAIRHLEQRLTAT